LRGPTLNVSHPLDDYRTLSITRSVALPVDRTCRTRHSNRTSSTLLVTF